MAKHSNLLLSVLQRLDFHEHIILTLRLSRIFYEILQIASVVTGEKYLIVPLIHVVCHKD